MVYGISMLGIPQVSSSNVPMANHMHIIHRFVRNTLGNCKDKAKEVTE